MRLTRLDLHRVRRFEYVRFDPDAGLNLLLGDNGAGKSTVLEALHLLAYGRSFRGRVRDGLIQRGASSVDVFAEWLVGDDPNRRQVGLHHSGASWSGRLDGQDVDQLGTLCQALSVVTFEPGSHALISGAAEVRRKYLDWGVFHVEQDSLVPWRRYHRALKQRNALLKLGRAGSELETWDHELADAGAPVDAMRQAYVESLSVVFARTAKLLVPTIGDVELLYRPGWRRVEMGLADALLLARDRDRSAGFTSVGPHRADASFSFDMFPGRDALSRGQAKLLALSLLVAQAEHQAGVRGHWPIVALDDIASELDTTHQELLLHRLDGVGAQVLMTGTHRPGAMGTADLPLSVFHVEQGRILESA